MNKMCVSSTSLLTGKYLIFNAQRKTNRYRPALCVNKDILKWSQIVYYCLPRELCFPAVVIVSASRSKLVSLWLAVSCMTKGWCLWSCFSLVEDVFLLQALQEIYPTRTILEVLWRAVYVCWWKTALGEGKLAIASSSSSTKARLKRRTVPNQMQMSENNRFFSFALDSAHVKFDVSNGPESRRFIVGGSP